MDIATSAAATRASSPITSYFTMDRKTLPIVRQILVLRTGTAVSLPRNV